MRVFKAKPFSHLVVGAPEPLAGELEGLLHPYLRERLCRRLDVEPSAPVAKIRDAALQLAFEIEREKDVVAQEIAEAFDTPDDHVFEMAQSAAFSGQPLGRPILGSAASISTASRDSSVPAPAVTSCRSTR